MQETVGQRIIHLRTVMGMNGHGGQTRFARYLEISPQTLQNIESGGFSLSREVAAKMIRKCPGITYEWLWHGQVTGLTVQMCLLLYDPDLAARLTEQPNRD